MSTRTTRILATVFLAVFLALGAGSCADRAATIGELAPAPRLTTTTAVPEAGYAPAPFGHDAGSADSIERWVLARAESGAAD